MKARFALALLPALAGLSACLAPAPLVDERRLGQSVDALLTRYAAKHGARPRVSLWLGDGAMREAFAEGADQSLACASSIKTAYLIEACAVRGLDLDKPLPSAARVLADRKHPAIEHFKQKVQGEIRRDLGKASAAATLWAMIRSRRGGGAARVSNAVYNAAANLVTAELGGPIALSGRLEQRWGSDGLAVRRYMLARRDQGDNAASARGLALVLAALARREVPGLSQARHDFTRKVMRVGHDSLLGEQFAKSGALDTHPQARIRSGFFDSGDEQVVYVVMLEQPMPKEQAASAGQALGALAIEIRDEMLNAVRRMRGAERAAGRR